MDHALTVASQDLANELRTLLEEIDPARWRDEFEAAVRQRVATITERLRSMLEAASTGDAQLMERLGQLRAVLERAAAELPARGAYEATQGPRAAWASFQREVQPAYEALAASLRGMTEAAPRPLRPTNYSRNLFHVMCGLSVVSLTEGLPSRAWLVAVPLVAALAAWSAEVSRRIWPQTNDALMRLFGPVAHAHERHRVNSSTWFVTALVILGAVFPRFSAAVGIAVLGFADPAAAIIGRRFGRTKLRAGRSLEGSFAFFVVGTVAAFTLLAIRHHASLAAMLVTAAAAALVGAVTELFTERFDDNFTIPVASASAAALVGALFGLA